MLALTGTSGWQYRHWRDCFYPAGVPRRRWLEYYASQFATVEDNGTFYRLPARGGAGKDGIRTAFSRLLTDVPAAAWTLKTQIYDGDVLFLEWAADAGATFVEDGIDTFIFRDGLIRTQTVRYTVQHRG